MPYRFLAPPASAGLPAQRAHRPMVAGCALAALALTLALWPAVGRGASDLAIDALGIHAGADLTLSVPYPQPNDPNNMYRLVRSGSSQGNVNALLPPVVVTGTADDRWGLSFATASMANSGFFHERVSVANQYPERATLDQSQLPLTIGGGADTAMAVTVRALGPDAPLNLGLTVFGAHMAASDYYSMGRLRMTLDLEVLARFDNDPVFSPWSYHVELLLNDSPNSGWTQRSSGLDTLGVGHPVEHLTLGPEGFTTQRALDIDFFHADLDLGLLQPGHTFTLSYVSAISINGVLTYAGPGSFASVDLTDPLTLGGNTSKAPITLPGLVLPSPVPEPGGARLLLAGLLLGWLLLPGQARRQRIRRAPTLPGVPAPERLASRRSPARPG